MDYIFDIDGTLVYTIERDHLYKHLNTDWTVFYSHSINDLFIPTSVKVLKALCAEGHRIILATGRHEMARTVTVKKLNEIGLPYDALYMRPDDLAVSNAECKKILLEQMREDGYDPIAVFEDNDSACHMWNNNGLIVYKVMHDSLSRSDFETL